MTRRVNLSQQLICFLAVLALAFLCLQQPTARADSLTLSAQYLENGTAMCSSNSNPAACTGARADGSLSTGSIGAVAAFTPSSLPLPNFIGETTEEASASAALLYNFTSSVSSGTAVINLSVIGSSLVSTTGFPDFTCPSSTPCTASAGVGIASDESFVGAAPGTTEYTLANIFSGNGSKGSPSGPIQIDVPISGGVADLSIDLTAMVECPALTVLQRSESISCTAIADYLDPLTISGASVYDSNGNFVPGATLVSQSGFALSSAATPEPPSIFLLATGVSLLGLATRRLRALPASDQWREGVPGSPIGPS